MAAPPLDSPCDGPVTYPGDTKILVKSSKERSGPSVLKASKSLGARAGLCRGWSIRDLPPYRPNQQSQVGLALWDPALSCKMMTLWRCKPVLRRMACRNLIGYSVNTVKEIEKIHTFMLPLILICSLGEVMGVSTSWALF